MVIGENCCIFIVLIYKSLQTIIAVITESKVIELFYMKMISADFLILKIAKPTFNLLQSISITVITSCSRLKLCLL